MSKQIKISVTDEEYARIKKQFPSIQDSIREFLGCDSSNQVDWLAVKRKIKAMSPGTEFTFRDVVPTKNKKEIDARNGSFLRKVCEDSGLAEPIGHGKYGRGVIYRRI